MNNTNTSYKWTDIHVNFSKVRTRQLSLLYHWVDEDNYLGENIFSVNPVPELSFYE